MDPKSEPADGEFLNVVIRASGCRGFKKDVLDEVIDPAIGKYSKAVIESAVRCIAVRTVNTKGHGKRKVRRALNWFAIEQEAMRVVGDAERETERAVEREGETAAAACHIDPDVERLSEAFLAMPRVDRIRAVERAAALDEKVLLGGDYADAYPGGRARIMRLLEGEETTVVEKTNAQD